jgi:hypothetical protein
MERVECSGALKSLQADEKDGSVMPKEDWESGRRAGLSGDGSVLEGSLVIGHFPFLIFHFSPQSHRPFQARSSESGS